jgi:hypothetical protein
MHAGLVHIKNMGGGMNITRLCNATAVAIFALGAGASFCAQAGKDPALAEALRESRAQQSEMIKSASVEDVGDADSFGRDVTYLGVAQSGSISIQSDCTPIPGDPPLGPDDRCITTAPSGSVTAFDERDIGRIVLPKNSTKSLICFSVTSFPFWNYFNPEPTAVTGRFRFIEGFTIENELLDGLTQIDPATGLPINGAIELPLGSPVLELVTLQPGQSDLKRYVNSRTCLGGIISTRTLDEVYGLPSSIVDKFFKKPITIRLNLSGQTSYVDSASIFYGVRFYGD